VASKRLVSSRSERSRGKRICIAARKKDKNMNLPDCRNDDTVVVQCAIYASMKQ
jgi:hypothetical protein